MSDKFLLTIDLGNAEMCTAENVAEALRHVASRILGGDDGRSIRDANGNTVGQFSGVPPFAHITDAS